MTDEEDDLGAATVEEGDDAVESGDISILNSLIGHGILRVTIKVDIYVLPMQGPGVVLGIQWLQNLGKVTHDYAQQTMEFTLLNKTYSLKGDDSFHVKKISLYQMQALLDQDGIYGVYEVHSFTTEAVAAKTQAKGVTLEHPELTSLLEPYESIFQDDMLRLQGLGSNTPSGVPYTEDEIMAIVHGGKQRGHIPGVGRVLPGQGTLFRSDDKFSQMLTQLESQPEYGGGSGSGGCGDDEPGDDEDGGEDEDDS
ncbi:hypothetical protein Tco_1292692 [Tanacetum coccineum]